MRTCVAYESIFNMYNPVVVPLCKFGYKNI